MQEEHPERAITEAAEKAAAAGDYVSAERLLREAAALQEERLGPLHPELANTLNNLGVVSEIVDKPIDAERCLRRACEIAKASFEPDHPFVGTSRKNLEDFCKTRRIPIEPQQEPARLDTQDVPAGSDSSYSTLPGSAESPPVVAGTWSRTRAAIAGFVLLTLIATFLWLRARPDPRSSQPTPRASLAAPTESPSPQPPAAKVASPDASGDGAVTTPTSGKTTDARRLPPVAVQTRTTASATPGQPLVAIASLCRDLATSGGWRCLPIENPVSPGPIFFYTRVKSSRETTVEHRWYRGERLRQVIELRIHPNATDGYRTYSRTTLDNNGTGDWRVELRTKDGALLHEERFVVR